MNNISEKQNYWLTIEPFVFIFNGKKEYLLYNTLSNETITVNTFSNSSIIKLLDSLRNIENLYSIELCIYIPFQDGLSSQLSKILQYENVKIHALITFL